MLLQCELNFNFKIVAIPFIGFEGLNCEVDIDECELQPNRCGKGRCENIPATYKCICENKKCGPYCNLDDPCAMNPCLQEAECISNCTDSTPGYTCICPDGWGGTNCSEVQVRHR